MSTTADRASDADALVADIKPRVDDAFAENNFATVDAETGEIKRERERVVATTTRLLLDRAFANDADQRVQVAMTKEQLYAGVFTQGPALDDPDPLERAVADSIATYIWSLTAPSYLGRVQRNLGDTRGATDVVLCRRKINGDICTYVTRNDDLVVDDFVLPGKEKMLKAAQKTRRDMQLVAQRRGPELEVRIQRELNELAARTMLALGATALPALNPGE